MFCTTLSYIILLVITCQKVSCAEDNLDENSSVKRTVAKLGDLTHVVLVTVGRGNIGKHLCSGSIISPEYILTAAHCLYRQLRMPFKHWYKQERAVQVKDSEVLVIAGVVDMNYNFKYVQQTKSKTLIVHPQFEPRSLGGFDIALIKVAKPFTFTEAVFPIEISEKPWCENATVASCRMSGYGSVVDPRRVRLHMWDVKVRHGEGTCPCAKRFQWQRMVCEQSGGEEWCKGDSGGGLICEDKIVAISHMIRDVRTCSHLMYPQCKKRKHSLNTYMFLCPFNDWIRSYVPHAPPKPESCRGSLVTSELAFTAIILLMNSANVDIALT